MKQETIDKIFKIWEKEYRGRRLVELNYKNNFTLLVAVILSAQSTDKGVNKITPKLFEIADSPEKMYKLGEQRLKDYIRTIGLYNSKAKNIIAMSKSLVDKFNSNVPNSFESLVSLPGVGRKTANIILNCCFNKPAVAVDTHVFRVSNRLGMVDEKKVLDTELALEKVIPNKWKKHLNHWMVLHGRYVCKAKNPNCKDCKISQFCKFYSIKN